MVRFVVVAALAAALVAALAGAQSIVLLQTYSSSSMCDGTATVLEYDNEGSCSPSPCSSAGNESIEMSCVDAVPTAAPSGYAGYVFYSGDVCSGTPTLALFSANSACVTSGNTSYMATCSGSGFTYSTYSEPNCGGTATSVYFNNECLSGILATCTDGGSTGTTAPTTAPTTVPAQLLQYYNSTTPCGGAAVVQAYTAGACSSEACSGIAYDAYEQTTCVSSIPSAVPAGYVGFVEFSETSCTGTATGAYFTYIDAGCYSVGSNSTLTTCSGGQIISNTYSQADCQGTPSTSSYANNTCYSGTLYYCNNSTAGASGSITLLETYTSSTTCGGSATAQTYFTGGCTAAACSDAGTGASTQTTCVSSIPTTVPSGYVGVISYSGTQCSGTPTAAGFSALSDCVTSGSTSSEATCSGGQIAISTYAQTNCQGTPLTTTFPNNQCYLGTYYAGPCNSAAALASGLTVALLAVVTAAAALLL